MPEITSLPHAAPIQMRESDVGPGRAFRRTLGLWCHDLTVQLQRSRLGPPPSWAATVRATLSGSLLGVIAAAAAARNPNAVVIMPGGVIAVTMLFRSRIRTWVVIVSAILAGILSGLLWLAFNGAHATQWVLAADAGLCPIAAVGVARLLTLIAPVAMVVGQPADEVPGTTPARQSDSTAPPATDDAAPPLPADLIQRPH